MATVSVALCTYNGARFLRQQVESVLAQNHQDLEIVAVDDASTDDTLAILREIAARDGRLRVHANTSNQGFYANFLHALSLCRHPLVAPCDQDDIWLPTKLSTLVARLGEAELVYCDSELVNENGVKLGRRMSDKFRMYRGSDPRGFFLANCVSGHAMLCTRALFERAHPWPEGCFHDWWLASVAAATGGIEYVDECLVHYRQHDTSFTDITRRRKPLERPRKPVEQATRWLESMASLPGSPHAGFFADLLGLWHEWRTSYFSPALTRFMLRHRAALYALYRRPRATAPLRMFFGCRLRRLTQPGRYA